jgi:hypothetical protein
MTMAKGITADSPSAAMPSRSHVALTSKGNWAGSTKSPAGVTYRCATPAGKKKSRDCAKY